MKKRIWPAASFGIPLLIALLICVDHNVYPFGDQCILHIDMYHQYCPFFTELLEKIRSGGSFFYSWNIGLGVDFVSLYAYYLASPLNGLLILCPAGFVIEFMTILVLLKMALCGLTFAYYLREHFKTEHFAVSIFGTAYALSAFMAAYAWNIMWTDSDSSGSGAPCEGGEDPAVLCRALPEYSVQLLYLDHDLYFHRPVVFVLLA